MKKTRSKISLDTVAVSKKGIQESNHVYNDDTCFLFYLLLICSIPPGETHLPYPAAKTWMEE
jgi:hypothetical protein